MEAGWEFEVEPMVGGGWGAEVTLKYHYENGELGSVMTMALTDEEHADLAAKLVDALK